MQQHHKCTEKAYNLLPRHDISKKTGNKWWWKSVWTSTRNTDEKTVSSHHKPWYRELPTIYTKSIHCWWPEELVYKVLQACNQMCYGCLWDRQDRKLGDKCLVKCKVCTNHAMDASYVDLHIYLVIQNAHLDSFLLIVCLVVHYLHYNANFSPILFLWAKRYTHYNSCTRGKNNNSQVPDKLNIRHLLCMSTNMV